MWWLAVMVLTAGVAAAGQQPEAIKQMGAHRRQLPSAATPAPGEAHQPQTKQYKLPRYFDYDLYRLFHGKGTAAPDELRRRLYLRTALKVFEQRAQFRAGRQEQLWSVNEMSDLTGAELETLRRPNATGNELRSPETSADELKCCSRDQVYRHIIAMLERASSGDRPDWRLSRALVEELEQKPLLSMAPSAESKGGREEQRVAAADEELARQQTALRRAVEASVSQQVAQALSSTQSSVGRQLQRHFSAYFGQPVQLKAKVAEAGNEETKRAALMDVAPHRLAPLGGASAADTKTHFGGRS